MIGRWALVAGAVLAGACGGSGSAGESGNASGSDSASGVGGAGGRANAGGGGSGGTSKPTVILPKSGLGADEIGVLVNTQDPQSVAVAKHYREARAVPAEHVYELSFASGDTLPADDFAKVKAALDAKVDAKVQAYAITWTKPFRVGCMSATSAFALGFDSKYCNTSGQGCGMTSAVAYFDSGSFAPFTDHGIRPAMAIVGATADAANAVIDRGVKADATFPGGDGFFVRTTDTARSVRWQEFVATVDAWKYPEGLKLGYLDNSAGAAKDYIEDEKSVLFYFTGLVSVPKIETNAYLPGAVADHLTSFGGEVPTGFADEHRALARGRRDRELRHGGRAVQLHREVPRSAQAPAALFPRRNGDRGLLEERPLAGRRAVRGRAAGAPLGHRVGGFQRRRAHHQDDDPRSREDLRDRRRPDGERPVRRRAAERDRPEPPPRHTHGAERDRAVLPVARQAVVRDSATRSHFTTVESRQ